MPGNGEKPLAGSSEHDDSDESIFANLLARIPDRESKRGENRIEASEGGDDGDEPWLVDLFARITDYESTSEPQGRLSRRRKETLLNRSTNVNDPLERARELFEKRFNEFGSGPPISPKENTPIESTPTITIRRGLISIGFLLLVSAVLIGGIGQIPEIDLGATDKTFDVGSPEAIVLPVEEARYLNRLFRESSHEIAYCGELTPDETLPELEVWKADTIQSDAETIQFKTENCPDGAPEVLLHTHPNGVMGLSEQDKRTLANHSAEIMCVQGGTVEVQAGQELRNIVCYRKGLSNREDSGPKKVAVIVANPAERMAQ